ncbi:unnamed protein product, partial [Laminaria digitata]
MDENRDTLRGHSVEEAAAWGNKEKARWWERRVAVDEGVGDLLGKLQERWLAAHGLAAVLLGGVVGARLGAELEGVFQFARSRIVATRGAMGEEAWLAVVRLALPEPGNVGAAEEISRQIHQQVRAAFDAGGAEAESCHEASPMFPSKVSTSNPRPIPDIERGRSAGTSKREEAAGAAVSVKPASTVADLRRELSARGVPITGLKLKADLLARLTEAVQEEARGPAGYRDDSSASSSPPPPNRAAVPASAETARRSNGQPAAPLSQSAAETTDSSSCGDGGDGGRGRGVACAERHPVVLVLDEELQAIPWEGLPCLRGRAVTRVPAVPFVFSALAAQWEGGADSRGSRETSDSSSSSSSVSSRSSSSEAPSAKDQEQQMWLPSRDGIRLSRGFYVVDPEANLPHTRKQLGPVFEKMGRRLGWSGVQGTAPTEEKMAHVLQNVDMFAYCGHGAGELLVGREAVAGFKRCAVAVLMGCSSGRLKGYGDFEPLGMVSSYLAAGSPAVVANLWDVTDRDIDRYSVALLE